MNADIQKLEKEKKENDHRMLDGVRSVMPVSAVINIVRGQYKTNAQIATGVWGKAVDKKLVELKQIQKIARNINPNSVLRLGSCANVIG